LGFNGTFITYKLHQAMYDIGKRTRHLLFKLKSNVISLSRFNEITATIFYAYASLMLFSIASTWRLCFNYVCRPKTGHVGWLLHRMGM